MSKDPVEVVAEELKVQREVSAPTDSASAAGAYLVLNALHSEGWRVVRASATDVEFDDDPDSPTYEQSVPVWTIAEVWTP